jgi:hypothetical protein
VKAVRTALPPSKYSISLHLSLLLTTLISQAASFLNVGHEPVSDDIVTNSRLGSRHEYTSIFQQNSFFPLPSGSSPSVTVGGREKKRKRDDRSVAHIT